jgi:hypothetical protein
MRGPAFEGWDQRAVLTQLVCAELAEAVCFLSSGEPAPPIDILHKKAVVLAPGTFKHIDSTHVATYEQMLAAGTQQLHEELEKKDPPPYGFFCLSAMPLGESDSPPAAADLLERVDALRSHGGSAGVLLFRERELYSMTALVNRYTQEHVRFVVGLSLLARIWEYRYSHLSGSFLEALSRLLAQNVRVYVYPMRSREFQEALQSISATLGWQWTDTDGWISALQLHPAPPLGHLYDYVLANKFLMPMPIPVALATQD